MKIIFAILILVLCSLPAAAEMRRILGRPAPGTGPSPQVHQQWVPGIGYVTDWRDPASGCTYRAFQGSDTHSTPNVVLLGCQTVGSSGTPGFVERIERSLGR